MKQSFLACALAAVLAVSALPLQAGEIVQDDLASNTLGQKFKMQIYLPDGYHDAKEQFPVIYMLHGAGSTEDSWTVRGGIEVTADQLIKRGKMRPSIIVMPTFGPASWYADANEVKAQTAFIDDLIPYIEGKYKARSDRAGRSIAGLSMGGYGALNLSLSRPDLFCAAGVLSPAIYDPLPPETSAARRTPQFMKEGKFDEQAWTNALYPARLGAYKKAGAIVPMWIESGDHDALGIVLAAAQLFWTLHAHQPKDIEYRVIDGDHDWMVFRASSIRALPYMSGKCEALER